MKYYGTLVFLNNSMIDKVFKLGYKGNRNQFRIVCKAKNMAEANRKAVLSGLRDNSFHKDYTSVTGNKLEIEMCDKHDFIFCIESLGDIKYYPISLLLENIDTCMPEKFRVCGNCDASLSEDGQGSEWEECLGCGDYFCLDCLSENEDPYCEDCNTENEDPK